MLSENEQLEIWWESLTPDQQKAVLEVALDADPPGWIVASLAAANVFLADGSEGRGGHQVPCPAGHPGVRGAQAR